MILYACFGILRDYSKMERNPIFISPVIFPVYKYNSKTNKLTNRSGVIGSLIGGFGILMTQAML